MKLKVQPVHQAQWLEFVFGNFSRQAAADLFAKLDDPFADDGVIEFVISVHCYILLSAW